MVEQSRYSVGEQQAGMSGGILKNKLGISDQKQLDDAEAILLPDAYLHFFRSLEAGRLKFDVKLLLRIHLFIFEPLYLWAGKIRTVDISKDGMLFVPARFIKSSLQDIEKILKKNIPTAKTEKKSVAAQLALVHSELNAIHPFREGNGRTVRLFLDLLAAHAGYNPIDWTKKSHHTYISACKAGMFKEYMAMERVIYAGLVKHK